MQDYRKLRVWRKAHALVLRVRQVSHRIRARGYSAYKLQLTKSAESVPYNIVEACGASTPEDMARFLDHSIKSTGEGQYQLLLGRDYGVIRKEEWRLLDEECIDIRKMLCGLRKKVLNPDPPNPDPSSTVSNGKTKNGKSGNG
jgi:four helix bundle protein